MSRSPKRKPIKAETASSPRDSMSLPLPPPANGSNNGTATETITQPPAPPSGGRGTRGSPTTSSSHPAAVADGVTNMLIADVKTSFEALQNPDTLLTRASSSSSSSSAAAEKRDEADSGGVRQEWMMRAPWKQHHQMS